MSWHLGPLASFDTETTGVDVENDRIVTAALLVLTGGQPTETQTWLADPGIDIPEGASRVHGITTEHAHRCGLPAAVVVAEVSARLATLVAAGVPLVVMNAPYDLTLLDRELQRHDLPTLAEQAGRPPLVLDPLVLDKRADPYRKGKRNLTALAAHYGVRLTAAHTASADALAAARIVHAIAERRPAVQDVPLERLHAMQVDWAAQQAESLRQYLARSGRDANVNPAWPLIPRQSRTGTAPERTPEQ